MLNIFVDHCVHRDVAEAVRTLPEAHVVLAAEVSLAQAPDEEIFQYAGKHDLTLFTSDKDFGDFSRFDPKETAGIIVLYVERMSREQMIKTSKEFFERNTPESLRGKLRIIEPARVRAPKLD